MTPNLSETINAYEAALDDYNRNAPDEDDAADAYAEATYVPPLDALSEWLATTPPCQRPAPIVPAMREIFGLSAIEVCEAIRESHKLREERNERAS